MDLQDPTVKMSKSAASDKGIIYVLDEPKRIEKKIKSAVTDSAGDIRHDREAKPGVSNLLEILAAATGRGVGELAAEYDGGGYGAFKGAVAEAVIEMLRPTQARYAELADDPGEVARILAEGAERARAVAAPTLARAKEAVGLLPAG
jgi:tryptophanyl-tRNA synthetase